MILIDINDDIFQFLLPFLTIQDVYRSLSATCKPMNEKIVKFQNQIILDIASNFLKNTGAVSFVHDSISSSELDRHFRLGNLHFVCSIWVLIRRLTRMPCEFLSHNHTSIYFNMIRVDNACGNQRLNYLGNREYYRQCIVADHHFPSISRPISHRLKLSWAIHRSKLPFVKSVCVTSTEPQREVVQPILKRTVHSLSKQSNQYDVMCSLVAYYEVKIHEQVLPDKLPPSPEVVCIGLCLAGFNLGNQQPGWRCNSWGYHGDDGTICHGNVFNSIDRPGISPPTFGAGDTVGCGLLYPPLGSHKRGGIFYTKNGHLMVVISFKSVGVLANAWYPVVGLRSYNAVEINCGRTPFAFDVVEYENHLLQNMNIPITPFRTEGQGISHILNEETVGFDDAVMREDGYSNEYVIHPGLSDPRKYVEKSERIIENRKERSSSLEWEMRHSGLSYFSNDLFNDTKAYNERNPSFCDGSYDEYLRLSLGFSNWR